MTAVHEPRPTQFNYQYPPQQYPGQFYPAQPNQPTGDPNRQPNKRGKKGLALIGAAAIGAGVVGGGLFVMNKLGMGQVESPAPSSPETEQVLENAVLTPEAVDAQKRFDANLDAANASVREGLSAHHLDYGNFFPNDAGLASRDMTPEEILIRQTAMEQWIKNNPDEAQAHRDVDLIAEPGSGPHDALIHTLDTVPLADRESTDPLIDIGTPYRFSEGVHDGVVADGDTWMIGMTGATRGGKYVLTFEWQQSADGTTGEWVNTHTYSKNDTPSFTSTFSDILSK